MVKNIINIDFTRKISRQELLSILKREASGIHISELMMADAFLKADAKYMHAGYREDYIKTFSKAFIARIKDIKDDKGRYEGYINTEKLQEFLQVLKKHKKEAKSDKELAFLKIAGLVAIYAVFVVEESIHPVGTSFPGGLKLRYKDGKYLCPVKEKNMENPYALCRFCVSVQDGSF